jgi:hypothetical protein
MKRLLILAALHLVCLAPAALPAGPKEEARALNDEGTALLKTQDYPAAKARFEAAYRLFPHEVVALNVALADVYLNLFEDAFSWLWKVEDKTQDPKVKAKWDKIYEAAFKELSASSGILRVEALPEDAIVFVDGRKEPGVTVKSPRKWLKAGEHNLVVLAGGKQSQIDVNILKGVENAYAVHFAGGLAGTVLVDGAAPGALLYVNGRNYGEVRADGVMLSPGAYELVAKAEGFEDFHAKVEVEPGATAHVKAAMPKKSGVRVTQMDGRKEPLAPATPAVSEKAAGFRLPGLWGWVTMGAGAALIVGGGVVNGIIVSNANSVNSKWKDLISPTDPTDPDNALYRKEWDDKVAGKAPIMYALYGVGGVALAAGATLWLVGVDGFAAGRKTALITPWVNPQGGGVTLTVFGF